MFMGGMGAQKQQPTNLGDLIMQKIKEKETAIVAASTDPRTPLATRALLFFCSFSFGVSSQIMMITFMMTSPNECLRRYLGYL